MVDEPTRLDYAATAPAGHAFRIGLLLILIVSGGLLAIPSFTVFYDIADQEPFYGSSPAQIRRMMLVPIGLECLWLLWCIGVLICICLKRLNNVSALLLVWAALWMCALGSGISQYASDLAVLESPNRAWIMEHGKATKLPGA